jgi:hypothetical protein
MTKDVCRLASSVPVNRRVTVRPANQPTLNVRCTYVVPLLRLENVPSVVVPSHPAGGRVDEHVQPARPLSTVAGHDRLVRQP